MSLSVDDFFEAFSKAELKEVELTTMGGRTVFLRALPYAKVWNFKVHATQCARARLLNISDDAKWDIDTLRAEDYLLEEAMCNHDGSKFFRNKDQFNKWRSIVSNEVVIELIHFIDEMNNFDDYLDTEAYLKDMNKKKSV